MITFTAEAKLEGETAVVSVKDLELKIGLIGSENPTPEELMLGAALSCMILTIYYISREMGVKLQGVEGYIEGNLDPKGFQGDPNVPPGLLQVKYDLTVFSDDERIGKVMELSMRRCPLKDTLMRSVDVDVTWKIRKT
ncbi:MULTISPECIES: OsmC family protein [Metallosphaera]|uniref:OsmC family protein n=3 Tax=Metallosphaera TaxID=41980 RepID=A4YGT2_METS5|nr:MULTISPECIES: OsmC family protein [Metallosphaera]ABP95634.1 OsmC family protein [Metallosphaera sedula DSM 5348]AIM27618.1 OsmC family protein [Metallosphaera sedula]AKV74476.1 peroxiredoxin [Metallosphaera sedula]AKV76715.1 peroxiredoxin [Metallosphaera sedula]AKV78966.1 peroxiredoxin [Metallosphaera sedula]